MGKNDEAIKNPELGLILGPNENVRAFINGKPKKKTLLYTIYMTIITLTLYLWLKKDKRTALVVTDRRVINYTRVIDAEGKILERTMIAQYIDNLASGSHTYSQTAERTFLQRCGCKKYKPDSLISLDFFRFKPKVSSLQLFLSFGNVDAPQPSTLSVQSDASFADSMKEAVRFLGALVDAYPRKGAILANPDEERPWRFVDPAGNEACDESAGQIAVDRSACSFGPEEKILDVLPAVEAKNFFMKLLFRVLCIVTCGIYYCFFLYVFPYARGFVALTDSRIINYSYVTKGKRGNRSGGGRISSDGSPVSFSSRMNFSFVPSIRSGTMAEESGCLCFAPEMDLTFNIKNGGDLIMSPLVNESSLTGKSEDGRIRVRNFFKKLLTINIPGMLSHIEAQHVPDVDPKDVLLMDDEEVKGGLGTSHKFLQRLPLASVLRAAIMIVTLCQYPERDVGQLLVTSYRVISVSSSYRPLSGKLAGTVQKYWFLPGLTRSTFVQTRGVCCMADRLGVGVDVRDNLGDNPNSQIFFSVKAKKGAKEAAEWVASLLAICKLTAEQRKSLGIVSDL